MKNINKVFKTAGINSLYMPAIANITKKNKRLRKIEIDKVKKQSYKINKVN
jgi:hypothetical protein